MYKKEVSKMDPLEKGMTDVYIILSVFILIMYFGDKFNIFAFFGITEGLTTNYDWLAFLGAIVSMFINALFVLFITIFDRRENTESIRQSQRPYLNIEFKLMDNRLVHETKYETYMISNSFANDNTIPTVKITNAGETVAIIDVLDSYVIIEYEMIDKIENEIPQIINKNKKISFKDVVKRLSIPSNNTINVCFDDEEFNISMMINKVEVTKCYIRYKDLFECSYEDYSSFESTKLNVIIDNKRIN